MKTIITKMILFLGLTFLSMAMCWEKEITFTVKVVNRTNESTEIPMLCGVALKVSHSQRKDTLVLTPITKISNYLSASHLNLDSNIIDGKYYVKYDVIAPSQSIKWCIPISVTKKQFKQIKVIVVKTPNSNLVILRRVNSEFVIEI